MLDATEVIGPSAFTEGNKNINIFYSHFNRYMLLNKRQLIKNIWLKKLFSSNSISAIVQLASINLHLISLLSCKTYLFEIISK